MIVRHHPNQRLAAYVEYHNLIYLSGQVPTNLNGDITQQTLEVLTKVDDLLKKAGSDRSRILTAQIWLKEISRDFEAFNAVWDAWLPEGSAPARAAIEANMARENVLVEIMLTAAKD